MATNGKLVMRPGTAPNKVPQLQTANKASAPNAAKAAGAKPAVAQPPKVTQAPKPQQQPPQLVSNAVVRKPPTAPRAQQARVPVPPPPSAQELEPVMEQEGVVDETQQQYDQQQQPQQEDQPQEDGYAAADGAGDPAMGEEQPQDPNAGAAVDDGVATDQPMMTEDTTALDAQLAVADEHTLIHGAEGGMEQAPEATDDTNNVSTEEQPAAEGGDAAMVGDGTAEDNQAGELAVEEEEPSVLHKPEKKITAKLIERTNFIPISLGVPLGDDKKHVRQFTTDINVVVTNVYPVFTEKALYDQVMTQLQAQGKPPVLSGETIRTLQNDAPFCIEIVAKLPFGCKPYEDKKANAANNKQGGPSGGNMYANSAGGGAAAQDNNKTKKKLPYYKTTIVPLKELVAQQASIETFAGGLEAFVADKLQSNTLLKQNETLSGSSVRPMILPGKPEKKEHRDTLANYYKQPNGWEKAEKYLARLKQERAGFQDPFMECVFYAEDEMSQAGSVRNKQTEVVDKEGKPMLAKDVPPNSTARLTITDVQIKHTSNTGLWYLLLRLRRVKILQMGVMNNMASADVQSDADVTDDDLLAMIQNAGQTMANKNAANNQMGTSVHNRPAARTTTQRPDTGAGGAAAAAAAATVPRPAAQNSQVLGKRPMGQVTTAAGGTPAAQQNAAKRVQTGMPATAARPPVNQQQPPKQQQQRATAPAPRK